MVLSSVVCSQLTKQIAGALWDFKTRFDLKDDRRKKRVVITKICRKSKKLRYPLFYHAITDSWIGRLHNIQRATYKTQIQKYKSLWYFSGLS